jgi:cytochrome c oxidase cbb3-type subunit 3
MSSGFNGALAALVVVGVAAVAVDYHYLRDDGATVAPIAVADAQESTPPAPRANVSLPLGPVGPVPGPAKSSQGEVKNPYADDPQALTEGRRMFVVFNCSGCHGGRAGGGMGPSLRDESWIYGKEAADIFDSIAAGRAHGMPAWGAMLPPKQIWQLVAYIQSLRTPQEPDAPQQ